MKRIILVLMVFASSPALAEPAPLQITAKVVELPKKVIACGRIAYKSVVRYAVITVDQGAYSGTELLVVETCPELRKVGETRKLRLWPVTKNDSFDDEYRARTGPRFVHRDAGS